MAGGTGALGQAVVAELIASGYGCTVTWVVEEERRRAEQELGDRATLVHADLRCDRAARRSLRWTSSRPW